MPHHIIIADDEEHIGYLLKTRLEHSGYQVTWLLDGGEALQAILADPPDLVVLDIMMPGLTGFEVLEGLLAHGHTRDIPVIILSALSQEGDIIKGLRAGAADYLTKPFHPGELVARVERLIALRERWLRPPSSQSPGG